MTLQFLSWRVILDILLIASILFFLYKILIRQGSWKIVSGIIIAAMFFIIASRMGLKGIEWIYRNLSHIAVLSFVVLFQPELRKMFEKAASVRGRGSIRHDEGLSKLIAESMWKMATKNIGAIMVIPGGEPIEQWLSGGHAVNAIPSLPLIMSIFDPHSPGHDGALVMKNGHLSSFGVRLPISQSGKLPEEYGTRHHAAMGLSERSDAIVIVASEERGNVSIFHQGQINPMKTQEQISETIRSSFRQDGGGHLSIRIANISKKVLLEALGCLAVAIAFWSTLIAGQSEVLEKIITIPVEYTATAEDVVMVGEKSKEIKVHIAGSRSDLNALIPSLLSVKIDLSKSSEGKQVFPVNQDNIRLPKDIRLLDIEPSSIEISLARLIRKHVGISPQLVGRLPEGFELAAVKTKPETVPAFLPSEGVGQMPKNLTTTPVYLENIREDATLYCKIIAPPTIQPVDKRWPDVEVFISVRSR